jgi:hypothetical protein
MRAKESSEERAIAKGVSKKEFVPIPSEDPEARDVCPAIVVTCWLETINLRILLLEESAMRTKDPVEEMATPKGF